MRYTKVTCFILTVLLGGTLLRAGQTAKPPTDAASAVRAKPDAAPAAKPEAKPEHRRMIDMAICLDTSNSMDALIGAAKQKLWAIVNEFASARPRPILRVALYQYGNDGLEKENGWVQRVCDLTDDLDAVYEKLFALTTHGGTEYVARVSRAATRELQWTEQKGALKMIVVAGNEAATQDKTFPLEKVCREAIGKGIIINTIFCGPALKGRQTGWADAARWADGQYAAIDQQRGTVVITTPYDTKLADLSAKLNETYLAYGAHGAKGKERQRAQDVNAGELNLAAAAQRAGAKATDMYRNARWDVVDAVAEGKLDLEKAKGEQLPEPMREMTPAQRKTHVEKLARQREQVRKAILDLTAKREVYVKKQMEAKGLDDSDSFDANLRKTMRKQAQEAGFVFE